MADLKRNRRGGQTDYPLVAPQRVDGGLRMIVGIAEYKGV